MARYRPCKPLTRPPIEESLIILLILLNTGPDIHSYATVSWSSEGSLCARNVLLIQFFCSSLLPVLPADCTHFLNHH